jgi:hypothetical protein
MADNVFSPNDAEPAPMTVILVGRVIKKNLSEFGGFMICFAFQIFGV